MATVKLGFWIADIFGFSSSIVYLFVNLGTWKSDFLFVVLAVFSVVRVVFYFIKQYQEAKLREIRIRERDFEVTEKMEESEHDKAD